MKRKPSVAQRVAIGGLFTALSLLIQLVGGAIGIGTYLAPLLAGLCTEAVRLSCGPKVAAVHWLAAGLLSLFLCPDKELATLYLFLLGWYPLLRPALLHLPRGLGWAIRLALFNAGVLAVNWALLWVVYGGNWAETGFGGLWLTIACLILGNIVFCFYDSLLKNAETRLFPRLMKHLGRKKKEE